MKKIFENLKKKKEGEKKRMFSEEKIKNPKENNYGKLLHKNDKFKKGNFLKKKMNE